MIIDETDHFLVLNKPAGWSIYPQGKQQRPSLTQWLKKTYPKSPEYRPVHRLDVETSGIVLCGKTQDSIQKLNALFRQRLIHKEYRALCRRPISCQNLNQCTQVSPQVKSNSPHLHSTCLCLLNQQYILEDPLGFDSQSTVRIKMGRGVKEAKTRVEPLQIGPQGQYICMKVYPQTGRQHQIRVHLSLNGYPIVGDKLYGQSETYFIKHYENQLQPKDYKELGFRRHLLHASSLGLEWEKRQYHWSISWPQDVQNAFPWLNF